MKDNDESTDTSFKKLLRILCKFHEHLKWLLDESCFVPKISSRESDS